MPEMDLVATVDKQAGLVQHIRCGGGRRLSCHMLELTLAELISGCGDAAGRFESASFRVEVVSAARSALGSVVREMAAAASRAFTFIVP